MDDRREQAPGVNTDSDGQTNNSPQEGTPQPQATRAAKTQRRAGKEKRAQTHQPPKEERKPTSGDGKNALQVAKEVRALNYLLTQATDPLSIYWILHQKTKVINTFAMSQADSTPLNTTLAQHAENISAVNHNRVALQINKQLAASKIEPKASLITPAQIPTDPTPIEPQPTLTQRAAILVENEQLDIQLATKSNRHLKATHHHYPGFYSNRVLPEINSKFVVINDVEHPLSQDTMITYAYSGDDTIITEQPYIVSQRKIKLGTLVYNTKGQVVSMIVGSHNNRYGIQNGFKNLNLHLTDIRIKHMVKNKMIAYADKQFDSKEELQAYLANAREQVSDEKIEAILLTTGTQEHSQLILHRNGLNICNIHLRRPLLDRYQKQ